MVNLLKTQASEGNEGKQKIYEPTEYYFKEKYQIKNIIVMGCSWCKGYSPQQPGQKIVLYVEGGI
jgi:hypothetical protein